jgi:predicted TIM-barrel fold metal-dependent hydrolase
MQRFNVLSADGHLDFPWLPGDLFVSEAPAAMKARVPRLVEGKDGPVWTIGERVIAVFPDVGTNQRYRPGLGVPHDRMAATGLYADGEKGVRRPSTPQLRVKEQEMDGVDGEVIYGIFGIDRRIGEDKEAINTCYRIYNDWIADFIKAAPNRFRAIATASNDSAEAAAAELRRIAKMGLSGVEVRYFRAPIPYWHPHWEPLWEAAEETGLAIHIHAGSARTQFYSPEDEKRFAKLLHEIQLTVTKFNGAGALAGLMLNGVLERHPGLRLVFGEFDLGWIPFALQRLDDVVSRREGSTGGMLPSALWRRQCYVTFQYDPLGLELLHHLGVDNVMWGNDYPHPDGIWPESRKLLDQQCAKLSAADRKRITHDNAARLYKFD